jgi:hypothetical protein
MVVVGVDGRGTQDLFSLRKVASVPIVNSGTRKENFCPWLGSDESGADIHIDRVDCYSVLLPLLPLLPPRCGVHTAAWKTG